MEWEKLGNIYKAEWTHEKLASHAANPLPVHIEGDVFRIFYSGRDASNRSSVGFVDYDFGKRKIIFSPAEPAFVHGSAGSFYEHGVSIGSCYTVKNKQYMLFMGWQSPPDSHWHGEIGRLIISKELTLSLDPPSPFIGLNEEDSISLSYPWVIETDDEYEMWYGSTQTWHAKNGEMVHVIKHACSTDGHRWTSGTNDVPHVIGVAQAFSRPTVVTNEDGSLEMWFSYRSGSGQTYRIGHATCPKGGTWSLALDECCLDISAQGWDSEMVEYPYVFDHAGERFMLYNGNSYGKTGFGLAVLRR